MLTVPCVVAQPILHYHGVKIDTCQVLSIYDGDTMTVRCAGRNVKVRLHCIDAPEMMQEPWGRWSRDYLRQISGDSVRLRRIERDRYGRTVAEVYRYDDQSLNLKMVLDGWGTVYPKYCDEPRFFEARDTSQKRGMGIWRWHGLHQSPWQWR